MAILIDGKQLAKELNEQTKQAVLALQQEGVTPGLAVVIVGEDPASQIYVRSKRKKAEQLGIHSIVRELPATISEAELIGVVEQFNADPSIHGILVQSPLPKHIAEPKVVRAILPTKDVDGFHPLNVGKLYANTNLDYPVACTPKVL